MQSSAHGSASDVRAQHLRILIDERGFGLNSTVTMNRSLARPPDVPVELANLIQVRAHAGIGNFLARLDHFEDRDMRIEGDPVLAEHPTRHPQARIFIRSCMDVGLQLTSWGGGAPNALSFIIASRGEGIC
jgi:hypothetical protein